MFEKGDRVVTKYGLVKEIIAFSYRYAEPIAVLSDGTWEYEKDLKKRLFTSQEIQQFVDKSGIQIRITKPPKISLYNGKMLVMNGYVSSGTCVYPTETQLGELIEEDHDKIDEWTLIFEGKEFKNTQALLAYAVELMERRENVD